MGKLLTNLYEDDPTDDVFFFSMKDGYLILATKSNVKTIRYTELHKNNTDMKVHFSKKELDMFLHRLQQALQAFLSGAIVKVSPIDGQNRPWMRYD